MVNKCALAGKQQICQNCLKSIEPQIQQERAKVEEEKLEIIGDLMNSLNIAELKIIELEKQLGGEDD